MIKKRIAVIASRLKCVDVISVEAEKWIDEYIRMGHDVHLVTGKSGEPTYLPCFDIPEMDYKHPEVRGVKRIIFGAKLDKQGKKAASILLKNLVKRIKIPLKQYIIGYKIQLLSVEDALTSFKNLPLAIALSEIISELRIPTIARIHYIPWENPYFTKNNNFPDILDSLPPRSGHIIYVTLDKNDQAILAKDRKIASKVIPNTVVLRRIRKKDQYNSMLKSDLGIPDDVLVFLQPTRVKRNKFVERSLRLVSEINDIMKKDNVLVLTGTPVYSRGNYFEEIVKRAKKLNVNIIFANDKVFLGRHHNKEKRFYSIHDAYVFADVVLYPNAGDAFGNPIIEAAAYKKPIVTNVFPNLSEFRNRGFRMVVMDQKVTPEIVSDTYRLIADEDKRKEDTAHNYNLVKKFFSSNILDDELVPMIESFEKQRSIVLRMVKFFPRKIWGKSGSEDDSKKEKSKNKPETIKTPKNKKQGLRDLRNRKGGYKEPEK